VSIVEKVKSGKVVIITSKSNTGKFTVKNPKDSKLVEVVVVD
jgi:hypothetical protein